MNIYLFWIGDESMKKVVSERFNGLKGANLFVGPSSKDHERLMIESKFYRTAIKNKIFSFASDIWRAWAIKKYGDGLYIDATADINIKQLNIFIKNIDKNNYEFVGFLENPTKVASCVFYSKKDSPILDTYLYYYSTFIFFIRLFKIAPEIMTKAVHKRTGHKSSVSEISYGKVKLMTLNEIVDKEGLTGIRKYGLGSWGKNSSTKDDGRSYWVNKADSFSKGFTKKQIKHFIRVDLNRGLWKLRGK